MTSAQEMEDELQQSVMLSTGAEYELEDTAGDDATTPTHPHVGNAGSLGHGVDYSEDGEELSDQDASGEDVDEEMNEDAEGEEDDGFLNEQIVVGQHLNDELDQDAEEGEEEDEDELEDGEEGEGEEEEDEDEEEGEEDEDEDEVEDDNDEEDGEDEDDDVDNEYEEGVGAVKIKPGESDDEAESEVSDIPSNVGDDSDDEPAWQEAEGAEEDDDESDAVPQNICMFCKQDEENDPSEDFETFLTCSSCYENAHQQCARNAAAMSEENNAQNWKCPDCDDDKGDFDLKDADADDASVDEDARLASESSDKMNEGLLESHGQVDAETPSVSNDAASNDAAAAADGHRMLRKRKTSSVEPDEAGLPLRRRRRNVSTDDVSNIDSADKRESTEMSRGGVVFARTTRQRTTRALQVTVERKSRTSLLLKLHVRPGNLKDILARKRRDKKQPGASGGRPPQTPNAASARRATSAVAQALSMLPTPFTTDSYSQPFYSFFDKETDEMKGKPYGGILTEAEADTSKTLPQPDDRRRFDQAKQRAEDEWRARILTMQAEAELPVRKNKKSSNHASHIECIEFGGWEIETWYAAPYPAEYSRNRVLYICEFCLKYMNSDYVAWRHKLKCAAKHPPGDEIYRHNSVSVFEVDGRKSPVYCQNLCLLAKLFLGSKTLYYDVEPFLFYVLCEYDDCGYHFVGYFSKEKRASSQNNVSCILTLPIHQRKGYGNLLIDFSYLLTQVEDRTGSPEKPLSDMGLVSYRNYWRLRLCRYFLEVMEGDKYKKDGLSIRQISSDTGMTPDDVIAALEGLRALARDPQTKLYVFRIDLEYCRQYVAKWEAKGYVKLKPEALAWTPYVMGRSNAVNFELGPQINTLASRDDGEAHIDEGKDGMNGVELVAIGEPEDDPPPPDVNALNKETEMTPMLSIEKTMSHDKEDAKLQDEIMNDVNDDVPAWILPYRDVPPSRFEVFPPIHGGRRGERLRYNVGAPLGSSTANNPRPRPKRTGSSARRPAASRPRSTNSARKKTGGTGRGPGRWPRGTKKSDYGNAQSGPGLPPGWEEKQARLKGLSEGKDLSSRDIQVCEKPAMDEVRVAAPGIIVGGQAVEMSMQNGRPAGDDEDLDDENQAEAEAAQDGGGEEDAEGEDE